MRAVNTMKMRRIRMAAAAGAVAVASVAGSVSFAGADYVAEATTIEEITQSVDYTAADANTLRLYRAFLNREPDLLGAKYWISEARAGLSLDGLAYGFAESDEFLLEYSDLTNADFLTVLYENMLDREADPDGYNYWLDEMNGGLTRYGVARWVVANDEFIARYPYTATAPGSPGDTKDCDDFASHAEAQQWHDHYFPLYGDIANLDGNADGEACESLR